MTNYHTIITIADAMLTEIVGTIINDRGLSRAWLRNIQSQMVARKQQNHRNLHPYNHQGFRPIEKPIGYHGFVADWAMKGW